MSARDNIEKVLRSLHVMLAKSGAYEKEPSKVIVDKQRMLDLLSELNKYVYDIMDEYELTKQSRDRAEREFQKKGDQIVWDASRKAEDIYAASVMYTDEALSSVHDIMHSAATSIQAVYAEMDKKLREQEELVQKNQSELKSQLRNLVDTEKYLKLIEERNREIEREKARKEGRAPEKRPSIYANRQTEVKVNTEYLEKLGISPAEEAEAEDQTMQAAADKTAEDIAKTDKKLEEKIRIDLDADYFRWKDTKKEEDVSEDMQELTLSGQEEDDTGREGSDFSESIHKVWKNLTSGRK